MALLSRKRVILAKTETTYGTDPTPTGAANAILVRNLDVTPLDAEIVSRDLVRPYFGNYDQIIAAQKVQVSFEVELQGAGAAGTAPAYGPLLIACGMAETVVASTRVDYKPVSSSFSSVTIYFQPQDNTAASSPLHKVTGCRGNVEVTMNAKALPVLKFTFTGIYNTVADAANLTATYTAFKTPIAVNKANTPVFTFFGFSGVMSEFGMNLNNDVVYRNLVNSESVILTDRKAGGTVVFEAPTVTAKDFWATALGTTLGSMQITHGTVAGSIVDISATSTVDLVNPSYTEMDSIVMLSCPYVLTPTTAGNDEFTISVK
ncbi:MAG: hypothetical protein CGW95_01450 [Phenylobacterium zucineum]|nr:MAG: hypothetical protein CGW95_01450 [Phenylobacterium zucineum]